MAYTNGLSVSSYNPSIDWPRVMSQGYRFVFTKATEGVEVVEQLFPVHWAGAQQTGLLRGAYHLFVPDLDPYKQADLFLATLAGDFGELPPVLILESRSDKPTRDQSVFSLAKSWLDQVEKITGRKPLIYSSGQFLREHKPTPDWAKEYPLWIAQFPGQTVTEDDRPQQPEGWLDWSFWHYSDLGRVDGITNEDGSPTQVDLNFFRGSLDELYAFAGLRPDEAIKSTIPDKSTPQKASQKLVRSEKPVQEVNLDHHGVRITMALTSKGWLLPADGFVLRAGIGDKVITGSIFEAMQKDLDRKSQVVLKSFLAEFLKASDPLTISKPIAINLDEKLGKKVLPNSPTGSACLIIVAYGTLAVETAADVRAVMRGILESAKSSGLSSIVIPVLISSRRAIPEYVNKARRMLDALLEISDFGTVKSVTVITVNAQVMAMARQRLDLRENNLAQALANDQADGDDLLNISAEVYALADTLLLREVHAPLAVGIMGGWGSGKSFVMNLLKKRMAAIRTRRVSQGWPPYLKDVPRPPFVGHIYQISFNAWTYAKSNLWASLMHTIFFELNRQISLEKVFSKGSTDSMLLGGDVYKNLYEDDYQIKEAEYGKEAREIMDGNLLWLSMREQKQAEIQLLRNIEGEIANWKSGREKANQKQLEEIQKEIGDQAHFAAAEILKKKANVLADQVLDERGRNLLLMKNLDVSQVEELLSSLRSMQTTWSYILTVIRKSSKNSALALLLAVFLVGSLVTNFPTVADLLKMDFLARLVTQFAAIVAAAIPVVRLASNWSLRIKEIVQEYQASVDMEMANWRATRDARIAEKQAADEAEVQKIFNDAGLTLDEKLEKLKLLAGKNVAANDKIVEVLQTRAEDQRRKVGPTAHYLSLLEFVRSRLDEASYEGQLGLMHQVKRDFDELTASMMRNNQETNKLLPRGEPRIVLFIDDLDRCPPARVVQVLEAVQLLLNTKLFVIVLGLDTRYVTRALEKEYKEILQHEGDPSGLDYIEKIIQIPYRVRPMEPAGLLNYLEQQMQVEFVEQKQETPPLLIGKTGSKQAAKTTEKTLEQSSDKEQIVQSSTNDSDLQPTQLPKEQPQQEQPPVELSPEVIKFKVDDLSDLNVCCQRVDLTPRSVKRLVNVLKLIKIFWFRSLGGDRSRPVKQTVMSLLALSAAYPEIMREVFVKMDTYFRSEESLPKSSIIEQLSNIQLQDAIEVSFAWQLALFRRDVKALQAQGFGAVPLAELEQTTFNIVRSFSFVGDPGYWTKKEEQTVSG